MSAENIAVARRWFDEVWNQRRGETIDELTSSDSVCYADDGPIVGPQQFRERMLYPFLGAFPDLKVQVEDIIGQGDQVVVRWKATANHTGSGLGFAPTHRTVHFRGLTWIEVRDGKFAQGWQSSNIPEVLRGLAPATS
jgi:steroid delta-isomerase-like uncharacterized protein